MRHVPLAILLLVCLTATAMADGAPYHAGVIRLTVPARLPFDTLVWYPTQAPETPWQAGPFSIPATRDAPFAAGRFPVVLMSHGGGLTGGSPLVLRDLSASLARAGFVVIAPFHGKAALPLRPLQVGWAFDAARADARVAPHIDTARLGMLGFSLGTAVTLELAGAIPNDAHLRSYCATHGQDVMSCGHAPSGGAHTGTAPPRVVPLPLKAIVLLDAYAVLFGQPDLTAVTMPVLLFRPEQSEMPGEANTFALRDALPRRPALHMVPGGHFVFTDVCPAEERVQSPEACGDPPGVDRAAVHRTVEKDVEAFFHSTL